MKETKVTTLNFTKAAIENLPAKEKEYQIRDSKTPGLFIRVNPGNTKTFNLYRKVNKKPVRLTLGHFPALTVEQARKQACLLFAQLVNAASYPKLQKFNKPDPTFKELFDKYYNEHLLVFTKRPKDNKAQVEYYLMSRIGSMVISKITREQMKQIHLELAEPSGKAQANRVLNLASAIFNFGIRENVFHGINPCVGIRRFKVRSRDRFLSKDELTLFFNALKNEELIYQDFFMLSLFIGARKSTMLEMQYSELDFNLKRWRLSEDQSKNDDVNIYVLPDAALEILQRRFVENNKQTVPSLYVFPGTGIKGHLIDPKKAFGRIKRSAGISNIRIHDLRRTLGSYMAIGNCSLPIIGQALNHRSQDSTAIYARLSIDPVLVAVNSATMAMQSSIEKKE
jgi:integrase